MKRFLFVAGGIAAVVLLALLVSPSLRMSILGISVPFKVQMGQAEPVRVMSMLLDAREIRGLSSKPNLDLDDSVQPNVYDLDLGLIEKAVKGTPEPVMHYEVKEEKLAQIGIKKPNQLLNDIFAMRLNRGCIVSDSALIKGRTSSILDDARFGQCLAPMWICRPKGRVSIGEVWSGRWTLEYAVDALDGRRAILEHRMNYKIEDIKDEGPMRLAKIDYSGEIGIKPKDKLSENTELIGRGRTEGQAYMNMKTGNVVLADDHTVWMYAVRLLSEDIETVRLFERRSRAFRPLAMPKAAEGFGSAMPKDGELPGMDQVKDKGGMPETGETKTGK